VLTISAKTYPAGNNPEVKCSLCGYPSVPGHTHCSRCLRVFARGIRIMEQDVNTKAVVRGTTYSGPHQGTNAGEKLVWERIRGKLK